MHRHMFSLFPCSTTAPHLLNGWTQADCHKSGPQMALFNPVRLASPIQRHIAVIQLALQTHKHTHYKYCSASANIQASMKMWCILCLQTDISLHFAYRELVFRSLLLHMHWQYAATAQLRVLSLSLQRFSGSKLFMKTRQMYGIPLLTKSTL